LINGLFRVIQIRLFTAEAWKLVRNVLPYSGNNCKMSDGIIQVDRRVISYCETNELFEKEFLNESINHWQTGGQEP
jgi:hypothetical protein